MNAIKRKKWLVAGALVACLVVLLAPFETTVVPEWKLRVVDQTGQPLRGAQVVQSWCHYTLESEDHEEGQRSNSDGYVQFPRRAIRTNVITWTAKFLARVVNVHSGFGPSASVYYLGEYRVVYEPRWYEPGTPLGTKIVVNASVTK